MRAAAELAIGPVGIDVTDALSRLETRELGQVAEMLAVSKPTVYRYVNDGLLTAIRFQEGGFPKFAPAGVRALIERSRWRGPAQRKEVTPGPASSVIAAGYGRNQNE